MDDFLQGQHVYLGNALLQLIHPDAAGTGQDLSWLTTRR